MVKAVFIDYMGTTVDEHSPEMVEIVRRICNNSSLHDPRQVQRFILDTRRRYEANSSQTSCSGSASAQAMAFNVHTIDVQ